MNPNFTILSAGFINLSSNFIIFAAAFLLVVVFGSYFATESERLRRILGTVITISVIALAIHSAYPPFDIADSQGTVVKQGKIQLGLDLKGGTSFLIRLDAEADPATGAKKDITKTMEIGRASCRE